MGHIQVMGLDITTLVDKIQLEYKAGAYSH